MERELLELLACPQCGSGELALLAEETLACPSCDARYPIINGVPDMLPSHLATALPQREAYTQRLRDSMHRGEDATDSQRPDTDRFMWEHHLYDWGKEVIFKDARAADIFTSYAEEGARNLCRILKERADGVEGKRLLYVGSGNDSLVSRRLEEAGAFLVNMDVVRDSMEDLKATGARSCVCGDARQLPFRAESFDVVFTKGSLHHTHPIDAPLRAMVLVTKRGGHIFIAEPNKHMHLPRLPLPAGLGHPTPYEGALSPSEVARLLAREGVSPSPIAALTHVPPGTPAPIALLWERLGKMLPWLLDRFAFEFILHGRRDTENERP